MGEQLVRVASLWNRTHSYSPRGKAWSFFTETIVISLIIIIFQVFCFFDLNCHLCPMVSNSLERFNSSGLIWNISCSVLCASQAAERILYIFQVTCRWGLSEALDACYLLQNAWHLCFDNISSSLLERSQRIVCLRCSFLFLEQFFFFIILLILMFYKYHLFGFQCKIILESQISLF